MVLKVEPIDALRSQRKTAIIEGKADEPIVIYRSEKSMALVNYNFTRKGVVKRKSNIAPGDLVTVDNIKYFCIGTIPTQVKLRETNTTIDILRIQKHYTGSTYDYDTGILLHEQIVAYYEDINGKMALYDLGIKSTSTRRFLMPILDFKLLDIIRFNGEHMQIDVINTSVYPGLLWVQCSPYAKVIK